MNKSECSLPTKYTPEKAALRRIPDEPPTLKREPLY